MTAANNLLSALSRAYVLSLSRPGGDPGLAEALDDFREIHAAAGWQVVRIESGDFTVQGEVVSAEGGEISIFKGALESARIFELRLQDAMEPEVLEDFLRRTHPTFNQDTGSSTDRFRGLEDALGLSFHPSSVPLRGMAGSVEGLFPSREEEEETPFESAANPMAKDDHEDAIEAVEETPSSQGLPLEVQAEDGVAVGIQGVEVQGAEIHAPDEVAVEGQEIDLQAYRNAAPAEKARLGEAILEAAERLKADGSKNALADLVEGLASPWEGTSDQDAQELARQIITPAIASHLVVRLGEAREEDERARMIGLCSGLGNEMVLALADALGEARDRYQRRSFMDAMLAQGALAFEVAREMVEDPRWFVARNGVSLMGEMGGEGVVSHLTGSLGNPDVRVRREAVLALAKLGGNDAEQLLLGMLNDLESDVRAMACRALGVLKVEKALKPLMRILEEDQEEDVLVECLQALGRIGDPGAVQLIEKRAVKSLFTRPSKEIRIAGYRALAGIGTPHAKALLEKAATDPDPSIKTVVQALLG